jgi:Tetracyclin repressor-like, C-terminal domain
MRRERAWMMSALERGVHSPESRLRALAAAHLRLLAEHPFLYELVYGGVVAKSATPEFQKEAIASFALLREAVQFCFPKLTDLRILRLRCIVLWGAVRGVAELEMRSQVPGSVGGSVDEWVGEALSTLLAGWKKGPQPGSR